MGIFSWLKESIKHLVGLVAAIFSGVKAGAVIPIKYVVQKQQEEHIENVQEKKENAESNVKNMHPETRNMTMTYKPYKISNKNLNTGRKRF